MCIRDSVLVVTVPEADRPATDWNDFTDATVVEPKVVPLSVR